MTTMESWPAVVFAVGIVSIIALPFVSLYRNAKKHNDMMARWDAYARASGTLRLAFFPGDGVKRGPFQLEGTIRGVPVSACFVLKDLGQWTRVAATCRCVLPPGFVLFHAPGSQPKIKRGLKRKYVELGDDAFDQAFLVLGDEGPCRTLLAATATRRILIELGQREPTVKVDHGVVIIEKRGVLAPPEELHAMLDVASLAVLALEQASAGHAGYEAWRR
jgi:hypothetical protein